MATFAVIGATSWGVTLASLLAGAGHSVYLACRSAEEVALVQSKRGLARLPEVELPRLAVPVMEAEVGAVRGIIAAVPAQSLRATLIRVPWPRDVPLLVASKGIDLTGDKLLPEVLVELGWESRLVGVLSGPNLAHEVAKGLPTASVVASEDLDAAALWQGSLSSEAFRVYTSSDVTGVALGGALKNVIAIATGVAKGLGYGTNSVATLMTRGLAEMLRLGVAMGADPLTFQGLAGVGDLAATCFSDLSRNHRMGTLLARGLGVEGALKEVGETVEGVATAPVAVRVAANHRVELPICEAVAGVVSGKLTIAEAAPALLRRPFAAEARSDL